MGYLLKKYGRVLWGMGFFIPFLYNGCGQNFESDIDQLIAQSESAPIENPIAPPIGDGNQSSPENSQAPVAMKTVSLIVGTGGYRITSSDGFVTYDNKDYEVAGNLNFTVAPVCGDPNATLINGKCCFQDQWSCYGNNGHSDFHLRSVAYGNGLFVAVGGAGFGISRTSVDGINWSDRKLWISGNSFIQRGKINPSFVSKVIFHKGEFLAMAGFGGFLYHSTDGLNWYNDSNDLGGVFGGFIYTGHGFFAVGQNGGWAYSSDGKTWDGNGNIAAGRRLFDPSSDGQVVLVREATAGGQTQFLIKNADNTGVWSYAETIPQGINVLIYSEGTGKFHAYAAGKVFMSDDGHNWQQHSTNINKAFKTVYYKDGEYVAQRYEWGSAESKLYYSIDGIQWTTLPGEGPGMGQNINGFLKVSIPQ